nr:hypothetical protein [Tanacetum cinerariifolium]
MPRGPVRDEVKVMMKEELEYDIPLQDGVMQPLTPYTVHITPLDDDYVVPAANLILDKHLNKFGKKIFDMIRVDENGNFIEDIKELSIKTHVECESFIQKLLNSVLTANDRNSRKNTSIGARDAGFGRGTQVNEDAQGYLRRNHPARVTP